MCILRYIWLRKINTTPFIIMFYNVKYVKSSEYMQFYYPHIIAIRSISLQFIINFNKTILYLCVIFIQLLNVL